MPNRTLTCLACHQSFYSNRPRSQCFTCNPHPRLPFPLVVVSKYEELKSYLKTALFFGVSEPVIESYIHNFGTPQPCTSRPRTSPVSIDLDWFDGWLLSDGSLGTYQGSKNARCGHSSSHRQYCEYVASHWRSFGLTHAKIYDELQEAGNICYHILSHNHPSLTPQFQRWYPGGNGDKRIPQDVRLSPVALREWYIGDGMLFQVNQAPALVCGSLLEQEMEFLKGKLESLFKVALGKFIDEGRETKRGAIRGRCWKLYFKKEDSPAFFSYIGPSPLPCYSYKWPSSPNQFVPMS